jgi:hypothetical protein
MRRRKPPSDAAGALVGGEVVVLALRVVELLLAGFDVDVGVGELAEVDLGAGDGEAGTVLWTGMLLSRRLGRPSGVKPLTGFMVMP